MDVTNNQTMTSPCSMSYSVNNSCSDNTTDVFYAAANNREFLYYSTQYQIVACLLFVVIFLVGLFGNILVIFVLCRRRSLHTSTNYYLLSLTVADCVLLLSANLPAIFEPFFIRGHFPMGTCMCAVLVFAQYLGADASALSIAAFTMERYIAICHPIKSQTICTVRRAKRIIGVLWCFSVTYCLPWLGLTTVTPSHISRDIVIQVCTFRLKRELYVYYYMCDFFIFYVIPLILSAVLYSLIIRMLLTSLSKSKGDGEKHHGNKQEKVYDNKRSKFQVIRMLIVIVILFAVLWLPYRAVVVYNSFASDKFLEPWFWLTCRAMVYCNSAVNPILYSLMSEKFRKAYKLVLPCNSGVRLQRAFSYMLTESTADGFPVRRRSLSENVYLLVGPWKRTGCDRLPRECARNVTVVIGARGSDSVTL